MFNFFRSSLRGKGNMEYGKTRYYFYHHRAGVVGAGFVDWRQGRLAEDKTKNRNALGR